MSEWLENLRTAAEKRTGAFNEKHRARAVDVIASHLCSTDMTDGFCGPRDGKCIGQGGERPRHRNCVVKAEGCLQALATRGMVAVWPYDRMVGENIMTEKQDEIADQLERRAVGPGMDGTADQALFRRAAAALRKTAGSPLVKANATREAAASDLYEALRAMAEFWSYGLAKPDRAEPTERDLRRAEELGAMAAYALAKADGMP